MANPHAILRYQDPDDVETVVLAWSPMPVYPHTRRPTEVAPFLPVHRLHGITELNPAPRFYLDKGDQPVTLDDEIDVAMPRAISAFEHAPPMAHQPSLGDSLAYNPEVIRLNRHAREGTCPVSRVRHHSIAFDSVGRQPRALLFRSADTIEVTQPNEDLSRL